MASNIKNPPLLEECANYESWEKSLELWQLITTLKPEQQGPAVALSLTGKAKESALEISIDELKSATGVNKILEKLGKIYKKDSVDSAYEAFESFIKFRRDPSMSIPKYIVEFEALYNKAKVHGCQLSSEILAYFLLNQAKLSDDHMKLVRATITKLDVEEMKTKLKKVFGSGQSEDGATSSDLNIKVEDLNIAETEDVLYGRYYNRNSRFPQRRAISYPRGNFRPSYTNQAGSRSTGRPFDGKPTKTKCSYCQSIFHYFSTCPERTYYAEEQDHEEEQEQHDIVLYQSGLITEEDFVIFVAESSAAAILDSGASATVAGRVWLESYIDGLSKENQHKVSYQESGALFKFGSGEQYKSMYKAKIPASIGSKEIFIITDVVETSIPLLLSKDSMKKSRTEISFINDKVSMFNEEQKVFITKSGHYAIPLNKSREIMKAVEKPVKIVLHANKSEDKHKIALKLHAQFGHPAKKKLKKLLERAGKGEDADLMSEVDRVYSECKICKQHTKPSPKPIVSLPHAEKFNDMVAMDLKFHGEKIILHLIDHLTRYSAAITCKSKEPREIINGIMKCWIAIFGPPTKFLTDNGGEFSNASFLEMAEALNIRVLTTAAESPWSNGLVERHNGTLCEILHKVLAENKTSFETALAWAVHAKNSLMNVNGFSPSQLVLGYNANMPSIMTDKPPALNELDTKEYIAEHLQCIQRAREAFLETERSERIKRALRYNIRTSVHNKFFSGDLVYYKRLDNRKWKGPGKVIGTDSSNVLIKHGSNYVRVHASRVLLEKKCSPEEQDDPREKKEEGREKSKREDQERREKKEDTEESTDDSSTDDSEGSESSERSCEEFHESKEQVGDDQIERNLLPELPMENKKKSVKKGMSVEYRLQDGTTKSGVVVRRTGKASGKYRNCWEIDEDNNGQRIEYDTEKDWKEWREQETATEDGPHDIMYLSPETQRIREEKIEEAKKSELDKWKEEEVFQEVEDKGQERLSTTWVVTTKVKNEEEVTKARLVIRGYEETEQARSDSPTCSKESIRLLISIAVAKGWNLNSLDVKAAFLQGKSIDREIYVTPPKEVQNGGHIWRLKKVAYGLADASRSWYLRVLEALTDLGMRVSRFDKAVFTYRESSLEGILMVHVDDMLYFGTEAFMDKVITPLKKKFKISREDNEAFKYVGMNIKQGTNEVILEQDSYLKAMKEDLLPLSSLRDKTRLATSEEKKIFKQGIGQLGWLTNISRPEGAYAFCQLSTRQTNPKMADFIRLKKEIRELKSINTWIKIGKLNLESVRVVAYCDASFGALEGGASQIGFIVFLEDEKSTSIPITWASRKARRVARSSLTAETLAAVEAIDFAIVVQSAVEEIVKRKLPPIKLLTDNKSLHDSTKTSNTLADKRLLIDMSALREMVENKELEIMWISSKEQLADVLTKAGVCRRNLSEVLATGSTSSNH